MTTIKYIDLPADIKESITLNCEVSIANRYEWKVSARVGAPYASHVDLGTSAYQDAYKPWEYTVSVHTLPLQFIFLSF